MTNDQNAMWRADLIKLMHDVSNRFIPKHESDTIWADVADAVIAHYQCERRGKTEMKSPSAPDLTTQESRDALRLDVLSSLPLDDYGRPNAVICERHAFLKSLDYIDAMAVKNEELQRQLDERTNAVQQAYYKQGVEDKERQAISAAALEEAAKVCDNMEPYIGADGTSSDAPAWQCAAAIRALIEKEGVK